jgi:hypothetical protein
MAEIVKRGEFSNRPYRFTISGDEPTVDEQIRIDQVLRDREFSFAKDYETKYGQQITNEGEGVLNYLGEIPKGIARGAVGMFESALLGGAAALPERYEAPAREGIRSIAYGYKPQADVGMEGTVGGTFGEALGSFGALGLTSLIPGGQFAAPALAVGAGAGEASERARAEGATEEERGAAALLGAPVGALELLPIKFIKVLGKPATGTIVNRLTRAAAEGGVEGAQEAATTIAQNLIEQGVYNPEQGTFSDTGEALGYGAGVGALVQGLLDLLPGRSRTATPPAPQEEAKAPTLALPAPEAATGALPAPGTLDPLAAAQTPDVVVPPAPAGAVRGGPGVNVPPLSLEATATANSIGSDPQMLSAVEAIEAEGKATVGVIQKALGLSYPAANGIMRKLESVGAVSKYEKGKERALTLPFKVSAIRGATVATPATPAEAPAEPAIKTEPTDVPKATVTAVPGAAVPVTNEAAAKADVPAVDTPPEAAPQPKYRKAAEAAAQTAVPAQATAVEPVAAPEPKYRKAAEAAAAATAAAPAQEVVNVPEAAAVEPEEVGVSAPSGGQSVEGGGRPADDTGGPARVEAPAGGGLGGSVPVPVGTAATAGEQPAPLTAPAFTGSPTEMQVRDAERQLAPMRDVREVAANSAAQTELEAAWAARMADKPELASLINDYSIPDALVLDDPTTSEDKRKVLDLFQPGAVKKGKKGAAPAENAQMYFSQFKRPIDALEFIVADATLENQRFKNQKALEAETGALPAGDETISPVEREFFSGMTQERAKQALAWVEANMSPQAQAKVRDLQRKYRKAQEAKVPNKVISSLPGSTAIGGRAANTEERAALEQELTVQATEDTTKKAQAKAAADAARSRMGGLDNLLAAVQETKAPIKPRVVGTRKMTAEDQIDLVVDKILGLKFNRPQEVLDLGSPLHPAVVNQLRRGNLEMALRALQMYAPNDRIKRIIKALAPFSQGTSVQIIKDLKDDSGRALSGQYRRAFPGKPSEILLNEDTGLSIETLLHEMTHAATINEMRNPASPLRKRMEKLFKNVKPMLSTSNGSSDVMEFMADAFSVPSFQQELAGLYPQGGRFSALWQFANDAINLVRRLIGMQPRPLSNALDLTDQMVMQILDFPISMTEISTPDEGATILNRVAQVDGSFPGRTKEFAQQFGDDASGVLAGASWGAKRTILGFMGMQPLADVASHYKIDGAYDLQDGIQQMDAAAIKSDQEVDGVLQIAQGWVKKNPNLKPLFDRIVTRSTVNQVDPSLTREKALKKYGADSDKMRMYDTLQKDWAAIGKDGRDLYNNMRQLYRKQYERLREALSGKIDFILSSNPELAAEVKKSIYTKFFDMNRIEPYFPLARKGDFWLEYSAFDPETGTTEPVKEAYDSPRARDRAAKELEAMAEVTKGPDGKPIFNYYSTLDVVRQGRTPDSLFVRDTLSIIRSNLANTGVDAATASSIQQEITRLFVDALPETSFAKSLQRRKNTRGYMEDSLEALRVKGYSLGRQGVRYAYSNKIRAVADAIQDQARNSSDQNKVAVIEELVARANFATNPPADMFERMVQTVNRGAFTFTIGLNVSSALVNLSSVPVVLYPYLSGRYGSRSSAAAIGNAYKLFLNSGLSREIELPAQFQGQNTTKVRSMPSIDNYFVLNSNNEYVLRDDIAPELRPMLQELAPLVDVASKNGQLNRSIYYDSIGAEDVGRARSFGDRFAAVSGAMFHQVERANRQVALVAAYNLELARLRNKPTEAERGLTEAERRTRAAERAVYQATETGGGATLATAPRWAQKGIGRVALMFKNYGLSMFYLQMKLAKQLTLGSNDPDFTPEDRRTAFNQLVGLQLSSFALAGIAGVPLYGLVSTVANAFLDDDEEDADMLTRRYLGAGLYKGFLSDISGLDISSRIGLTGLLIRENRYNTDPSAEETLVANLGGPAWSTATQFGRGVSEFYKAMTGDEGDMVRGIENMVPAAIRNFIKSGRYLSEGGAIETRRGDVITGDLGSSDLLGQMLGFTPTKATLQQDINQLKVKISNAVSEKRSRLSKLYYIALREGDIDGAQEVLEDIRSFNEGVAQSFPDAVIDGEFLKRSLKSHQRTSGEMLKGVSVSPAVREGLVDLESMYNQGFQLF